MNGILFDMHSSTNVCEAAQSTRQSTPAPANTERPPSTPVLARQSPHTDGLSITFKSLRYYSVNIANTGQFTAMMFAALCYSCWLRTVTVKQHTNEQLFRFGHLLFLLLSAYRIHERPNPATVDSLWYCGTRSPSGAVE